MHNNGNLLPRLAKFPHSIVVMLLTRRASTHEGSHGIRLGYIHRVTRDPGDQIQPSIVEAIYHAPANSAADQHLYSVSLEHARESFMLMFETQRTQSLNLSRFMAFDFEYRKRLRPAEMGIQLFSITGNRNSL